MQSFDTMLPRDVRHVRLYSQHPPGTSKARSAGGTTVQPSYARGPPIPSTRLIRSNSTGNAPQLALEAARSNTVAAIGNSNVRNARDLRGNLVIQGPGDSSHCGSTMSRHGGHVMDVPVLSPGTTGYHTLAGLHREGAPELTSSFPVLYSTNFTRPSTAGDNPMSRAKRVSFAGLSALRQFVPGNWRERGDDRNTRSEDGGASGFMSGAGSQSVSDLWTLHGAHSGTSNTTMAAGTAAAAASDLSWMFTQHQAVLHGFDDLGLPAQVVPLYRRGSNVVSCFVEMGRQAADQQVAAMAKLVVMDPAEHRTAEREVATLLRPEFIVTVPEKAFYKF